jgi:hypothetical protein
VPIIVDRPGIAAISFVWAPDMDTLHKLLHGVAPSIATSNDEADMAFATGFELVAA